MIRLICLFFGLVACRCWISLAQAHVHDHSCNHGHPSISQAIYQHPVPPHLETYAQRRNAMRSQSTNFRPMKILLNTTFIDVPSSDISKKTSGVRVCLENGQRLVISEETSEAKPITEPCINSQGVIDYVGNCFVTCGPDDLVTPSRADVFKQVMEQVKTFFEEIMRVENLPAYPSVFTDGECGDLKLTNESTERDLVVFLTMRTMPYLPTTLAFANPCTLHPLSSRPITMHVNVQPKTLDNNPDLYTVLRHEVLHGLGFSSDMYKFYRNPDDRTKTYYQSNPTRYPTGPLKSNNVDAISMNSVNNLFGPQVDISKLGPGNWLKLISPNVVAFGRKYFDCPTLDGVELENDGNNASAATHWESRILYWELMTAVQKNIPGKFTGFTVALIKDMGFYDVNGSFVPDQMDFGFKKGCPFVNEVCSHHVVDESSWYFCNSTAADYCGYNNQFIGRCNLVSFSIDLPKPYQYFPGEPRTGGKDEFMNRCPMIESFTNGFCENRPEFVGGANPFLEANGSSSRCYRSRVLDNRYSFSDGTPSIVRCFRTVCVSNTKAMVRLGEYVFPCTANSAVEFVGPVTSPNSDPQPHIPLFIRNTAAKGIFTCSDPYTMCDEGLSTLNAGMKRSQYWPTITALPRPNITLEGGETFVIHGNSLSSCVSARIGEEIVAVTPHNESTLSLIGPEFKKGTAGIGAGGEGEVQLQLKCKVTGCEEGCYVAYATVLLYPTPQEDSDSSVSDFFGSVTGYVVLGVVGVLVVGGLAILFKTLFCPSKQPYVEEDTYSLSPKNKRQKPLMVEEMHGL